MMTLLLAMQAMTSDTPAAPKLKLLPSGSCAGQAGEIVVCGRDRSGRYRLRRDDMAADGKALLLPRAQTRLFDGGTLSVEGERVDLMPGVTSSRMMLRLRIRK